MSTRNKLPNDPPTNLHRQQPSLLTRTRHTSATTIPTTSPQLPTIPTLLLPRTSPNTTRNLVVNRRSLLHLRLRRKLSPPRRRRPPPQTPQKDLSPTTRNPTPQHRKRHPP